MVVQQVLAHGVAGEQQLVGGEELLHALVGHADSLRVLGQQLVGDPGIRVLLLYQGGDAHQGGGLQQGAAGIAAHAHGCLGAEVLDYLLRLPLAAQQLDEHAEVLPQVLAVEACHRQPDDGVACVGHALHLHASLRAYKEYLGLRAQLAQGVGYGDGGEDVPARAAPADDDARGFAGRCRMFIVHIHDVCNVMFMFRFKTPSHPCRGHIRVPVWDISESRYGTYPSPGVGHIRVPAC